MKEGMWQKIFFFEKLISTFIEKVFLKGPCGRGESATSPPSREPVIFLVPPVDDEQAATSYNYPLLMRKWLALKIVYLSR